MMTRKPWGETGSPTWVPSVPAAHPHLRSRVAEMATVILPIPIVAVYKAFQYWRRGVSFGVSIHFERHRSNQTAIFSIICLQLNQFELSRPLENRSFHIAIQLCQLHSLVFISNRMNWLNQLVNRPGINISRRFRPAYQLNSVNWWKRPKHFQCPAPSFDDELKCWFDCNQTLAIRFSWG